jgi:putative FmdB family regulatory protein
MVYEYYCESCNIAFDVVKSTSEYNSKEYCQSCLGNTVKLFSRPQLIGLSDRAEYNPAFGCIVKNKQHRNELAKRHGFIEVGNEKVDFTKQREDKRAKNWESV